MDNKKNTPSLDLSYVYGAATFAKLAEHDIEKSFDDDCHDTGDTTIRAVTSLFTGKRLIEGRHDALCYGYDPYNSADELTD